MYDDEIVYGSYERVNPQTARFIQRFGLDERLFTREVNGVSIDNELLGNKRTHSEMAKHEATKEAAKEVPKDGNEIEIDFDLI